MRQYVRAPNDTVDTVRCACVSNTNAVEERVVLRMSAAIVGNVTSRSMASLAVQPPKTCDGSTETAVAQLSSCCNCWDLYAAGKHGMRGLNPARRVTV